MSPLAAKRLCCPIKGIKNATSVEVAFFCWFCHMASSWILSSAAMAFSWEIGVA